MNTRDEITDFIEKPSLINAGLYILDFKIIEYIPKGVSDFGEDVFPNLVRDEFVTGFLFKEPLIAIDTPELLKEACK